MTLINKMLVASLWLGIFSIMLAVNVTFAAQDEAGFIQYGNCQGVGGFVPLECFQGSRKLTGAYYTDDLGPFMNKVFVGAISLGAILAVLRLAWAGFVYMSSDLWTSKDHAKEIIRETLLGLFLLLGIWLILYQINPDILKLRVGSSTGSSGGTASAPTRSTSGTLAASGGKTAPTASAAPVGTTPVQQEPPRGPDNVHCATRFAGGFGAVDCFENKQKCEEGIDVLPNFVRGSCKDAGPARWYGGGSEAALQEATRIQNLTSGERDAELRRIQTAGMAEDERIRNLPSDPIEQFENN